MQASSRRIVMASVAFVGLLLAALAMVWTMTGETRAATITVTNLNDSGPGSLRDAITGAASGDTIEFVVTGTITLTSGELVIGKNLTIDGPGSGDLTISGNNTSRVVNITSGTVAISGLTIRHGKASGDRGGGIFNNGALTMNNVSVSDNTATKGSGGGIYSSGTLTLTGSTIKNNVIEAGGDNFRSGGGIANSGRTATVIRSIFSNNKTTTGDGGNNGGAIFNIVGALTVTKSFFSENRSDNGGAVINDQGTLVITDSTFSNNSARFSGGGVFSNGTTEAAATTFFGNIAIRGGAIYNHQFGVGTGMFTLENGTVSGNSGNRGGGLWNAENGTLFLVDSVVKDNSANKGGGVYNDGGTLTMMNGTLSNNTDANPLNGAAIYSTNSGSLTIDSSVVSGNTAPGIYGAGGTVTLSNSTVSGNSETGILNQFGTVTITNSTISNNNQGIGSNGTLTVVNTTVSANTGPGIVNNIGTATVTHSTVVGQTAVNGIVINSRDDGTLNLTNSVIADWGSGRACAGAGTVTSLGHNLTNDDTCGLSPASGDLPNTDPLLGPLADNGGPTQTHALLAGSPAIDAIPLADCTDPDGNPVTTDQRGVSRPQGVGCDIGAFELEPQDIFVYSAKIACVPHLGPASPALMPGKYRTAVNVHNPSDQPAYIQKWVTLSPPQGQPPITGDRISETLAPWSAFDVDCPHMRDQFGLPQGAKVPGGKGFLVIRSDRELDVVAVYTARTETAAKDGVGTSVDVERVEPR